MCGPPTAIIKCDVRLNRTRLYLTLGIATVLETMRQGTSIRSKIYGVTAILIYCSEHPLRVRASAAFAGQPPRKSCHYRSVKERQIHGKLPFLL